MNFKNIRTFLVLQIAILLFVAVSCSNSAENVPVDVVKVVAESNDGSTKTLENIFEEKMVLRIENVSFGEAGNPIEYSIIDGNFYIAASSIRDGEFENWQDKYISHIYKFDGEQFVESEIPKEKLKFVIPGVENNLKFIINERESIVFVADTYMSYNPYRKIEGKFIDIAPYSRSIFDEEICYYDNINFKFYFNGTDDKNKSQGIYVYDVKNSQVASFKTTMVGDNKVYCDFIRIFNTPYAVYTVRHEKNKTNNNVDAETSNSEDKIAVYEFWIVEIFGWKENVDKQKDILATAQHNFDISGLDDSNLFVNGQSIIAPINILIGDKNIFLRDNPDGNIVGVLDEGTVVDIVAKKDDWYKINSVCWVPKKNVLLGKSFDETIKSADNGDNIAQYILGCVYYNTEYYNSKKAFEWFIKSTDNGYMPAKGMAGYFYNNNSSIEKPEVVIVLKYYKELAEYGYVKYQYLYSDYVKTLVSWDERDLTLLRKAAESGYAQAQIDMARYCYSNDENDETDRKYSTNESLEGLYWLKKAAAQGNYFALDMLKSGSIIRFFAG